MKSCRRLPLAVVRRIITGVSARHLGSTRNDWKFKYQGKPPFSITKPSWPQENDKLIMKVKFSTVFSY